VHLAIQCAFYFSPVGKPFNEPYGSASTMALKGQSGSTGGFDWKNARGMSDFAIDFL